jgi:hypothetical protein
LSVRDGGIDPEIETARKNLKRISFDDVTPTIPPKMAKVFQEKTNEETSNTGTEPKVTKLNFLAN